MLWATMLDPISSHFMSMNTLSLLSYTTRTEMRAESLKRWVACLAGGISITWILRVLWVQYGQHSRAIRLFNRVVLKSHCAGLCRASRHALCPVPRPPVAYWPPPARDRSHRPQKKSGRWQRELLPGVQHKLHIGQVVGVLPGHEWR